MMASAFPLTSTLSSNHSLQMPLRPSTTQPGTLSTPPPLPPPSHLLFLHRRDTQYLLRSRRHETSKPPDTTRARTSLFRSLSSAPASAVSPTSGNTQPPSARSASSFASPSSAPPPSSSPPVSNNNAPVTTTEHASPTHVSPSAPITASGCPSASSFEPEHKPDRHISPHQHRTSSTTALTHCSARQSQVQQARQPDAQPAAHAPTTQATACSRLQEPRGNQQKSSWSHGFVMAQKNRSTSSLLERRGSIMGARNLFSSSSSGAVGAAEVEHLQRPRTSAGAAEASPTKSRFSRLRYRRNREKTTTEPDVAEQQQQRRQTTLEQLPEGAFLELDDDAAESESRPSTSSSVKSSGGWSWSMRSRRSSVGLRERWRASSISSSSSSLSSASSYISSSSSSTSSTWSSLESTPRASIASSRTSYSSDDEDIRPQKEITGTTRPTKTVRAYVCRHFVSIPIPEEEPDAASTADQDIENNQQPQQPQPLPTPSPDENEGCMTDPMADAFDLDAHLPPPHILRPWAEPTPPPTPPLQPKQLQLPTEHLSVPQSPPPAQGVPTFILTPASPIQPSSTSPFSSSPPSAAIARRSFSAPVTANPSTVPTTGLRRRSTSNESDASSSRQKVEKGTPAHCPTCVRLQESMVHMRKVAGIYGPRHSLTVAAAKNARAARVAWAEAQWEASCADDGPDDAAVKSRKEGLTAEQGKKKTVSIQPGATFFVDREPFVQGPPSTSAGDDAEEEEAVDIEAQLQREMIIGQRLWGPLGERGRKQRDFKRSLSESYVPGRWAVAAGNEWLDTSGRTQTYEEFWEGKAKGKDGGSVLLGGKVIRGVLGKMVPGAGHAKRERERAERLERGIGLDVD